MDSRLDYDLYLLRAESFLKGDYGKFKGRLVCRLTPEQFVERYEQLAELLREYESAMARGDTVNDAIVTMIDELGAELFIDEPFD